MPAPSADFSLSWPTARPTRQEPLEAKVLQPEFHHDMLVLDYAREPHAALRFKEGTPVIARWGFEGMRETFYGTVLFIRAHLENNKHTLRVVCIGASYPLKDSTPAVFQDIEVERVLLREVIRQHLSLVVEQPSQRWPIITRNSQETAWEFYCRLAKRLGYTWFVNKTTAYCYDPVKELRRNSDSLPVLDYVYSHGNDFSGKIITFTPTLGDQGVPRHEHREKRLLAVNPRDASVINTVAQERLGLTTARSAPKFSDYLLHPANTSADAQARVQGSTGDRRWSQKANAVVRGNARVHQGTGVIVAGVDGENDGIWYVRGVEHRISQATKNEQGRWRYFMMLDLARDGREKDTNRAPLDPARRPLRRVVQESGRESNVRPAEAIWNGTRWISSPLQQRVLV